MLRVAVPNRLPLLSATRSDAGKCKRVSGLNEASMAAEIDRLRKRDFDLCQTIGLLKACKGIMSIAAYKKIRSCLHPDRVQDDDLKKRFEEAFNLFSMLDMYAVDPKQAADKRRTR